MFSRFNKNNFHYKQFFIFSFMLFLASAINAQNINLRVGGGYYFYNLNQTKSAMKVLEHSLNFQKVPVVITNNFPNNFTGQIGIDYKSTYYSTISIFFGYQETGGRLHYKDYSGEFDFTLTTKRKTFGLDLFFELDDVFYPNFSLGFGSSILISSFYDETFQYFELNNQTIFKEKSEGGNNIFFGFLPHLNVGYEFSTFKLNTQFGYEINVSAEQLGRYIIDENVKEIKAGEFSGMRLDFIISTNPFQYF